MIRQTESLDAEPGVSVREVEPEETDDLETEETEATDDPGSREWEAGLLPLPSSSCFDAASAAAVVVAVVLL